MVWQILVGPTTWGPSRYKDWDTWYKIQILGFSKKYIDAGNDDENHDEHKLSMI